MQVEDREMRRIENEWRERVKQMKEKNSKMMGIKKNMKNKGRKREVHGRER